METPSIEQLIIDIENRLREVESVDSLLIYELV